jgi:hypothetical protein
MLRLVGEHGAVLPLESGRLDLLTHAEAIEEGEARGQQRLADVEPGEPLALEADDVESRPRQEGGGGRPGRTAAHDGDVAPGRHGPPLRPAGWTHACS